MKYAVEESAENAYDGMDSSSGKGQGLARMFHKISGSDRPFEVWGMAKY
jgi:hypothetical protein